MTPEMLELARRNAAAAGVDNVELLEGYLEEIPLPSASADVGISSCVINLAADKPVVLATPTNRSGRHGGVRCLPRRAATRPSARPRVPTSSLLDRSGQAEPCQLRQLVTLVRSCGLRSEEGG